MLDATDPSHAALLAGAPLRVSRPVAPAAAAASTAELHGRSRASRSSATSSQNVGGDRVERRRRSSARTATRTSSSPTPADARASPRPGSSFVNGLGFEGWMAAPGQVVRRRGAGRRGDQGRAAAQTDGTEDGRPRARRPACLAVRRQRQGYVANIRDALVAADPGRQRPPTRRTPRPISRLDALDAEVRAAIAAIPPDRRQIITSHDAFGYFGTAYGMAFIAPQGVSTEAEASAKDVARIIRQIRREKIPAVFLENISDPRLVERIAEETRRQDRRHGSIPTPCRRRRPGAGLTST